MIATEPATRRVIVGRGDALLRSSHACEGRQLDLDRAPPRSLRAEIKIRNKHAAAPATIRQWIRRWKLCSMNRSEPSRPARVRFFIQASWCWAAAGSSAEYWLARFARCGRWIVRRGWLDFSRRCWISRSRVYAALRSAILRCRIRRSTTRSSTAFFVLSRACSRPLRDSRAYARNRHATHPVRRT